MIKSIVILSGFILVSLWEYCMFFYRRRALPYAMGYSIFSIFQWVIIAFALIRIFGWLYGVVGILISMFLLQYVTHFTLGFIYNFLFKNNPLPALALFGIMVWVTGGLTVILYLTTN